MIASVLLVGCGKNSNDGTKKPDFSEDGRTVTYGIYPQTCLSDSTLISTLNTLQADGATGWYKYEGNYYAKLEANPRHSSYTFDNGKEIKYGETYWFKCEPIIWNILSKNNNEYLVVSTVLYDCIKYQESSSSTIEVDGIAYSANNYEFSTIRSWLNSYFFSHAFVLGNSHVRQTLVNNSAATTAYIDDPNNSCNDTTDYVFMLSYQDYFQSSYGFNSPSDRFCRATDWSKATGAWVDDTSTSPTYKGGIYWTRSPSKAGYYGTDNAMTIDEDGVADSYDVDSVETCVRPAIVIRK